MREGEAAHTNSRQTNENARQQQFGRAMWGVDGGGGGASWGVNEYKADAARSKGITSIDRMDMHNTNQSERRKARTCRVVMIRASLGFIV